MYKIQNLLGALLILLLLTGCTSFQAKEARRSIALGFLDAVLENATDKIPYETTAHSQYRKDIAEREEDARRKREREKRHYQEEAEALFAALEVERLSGQSQLESTVTDNERRERERLSRRTETLENKAKFDRFMRELEAAKGRNSDQRFDVSLAIDSFRQSASMIDDESAEKSAGHAPLTINQRRAR